MSGIVIGLFKYSVQGVPQSRGQIDELRREFEFAEIGYSAQGEGENSNAKE